MTEDQIKYMANRFLGWKLPKEFRPDAGISFEPEFNKEWNAQRGQPPQRHEPIGTNLFDADQSLAMVRYMAEGAPASHDFEKMKDYAWRAAAILRFLLAHDGECLGDNPDWIKRINAMLAEQPG